MRISSLVASAGFGALLHVQGLAADRITDASFATRSEVIAPHAMAATSQPLATQIALDVMKQGGSAVDAAIAANAACDCPTAPGPEQANHARTVRRQVTESA